MSYSRSWVIALLCILPGCDGKLLPNFDGGVLNPEFRHLRAADVMNGVKCAMVAFMIERENELIKQREEYPEIFKAIETKIDEDDAEKNIYFQTYTQGAKRAEAAHECGKGRHWDAEKGCVANRCDKDSLGISLWDYRRKGLPDKAKGCVPVPDYSRFALDPNQSATITFTLNGTNSGFINYSRIDATKLDGLYPKFIVEGGGARNQPFPQLQPTLKGTTSLELAVVMPQSVHTARAASPVIPDSPVTSSGIPFSASRFTSFKPGDVDLINKATLATKELAKSADYSQELDASRDKILDRVKPGTETATGPVPQALAKWLLAAEAAKASNKEQKIKQLEVTTTVQPKLDDLTTLRKVNDEAVKLELLTKGKNPNPVGLNNSVQNIQRYVSDVKDRELREELQKKAPQLTPANVVVAEVQDKRPAAAPATTENFTPQALSARAAERSAPIPPKAYPKGMAPRGPEEAPDPGLRAEDTFPGRCIADHYGYRIDKEAHIDYLALKKMLHNVVNQQNADLHRDGPPLTLDSLTLSTTFQMTLELQAGTNHIFRIVPLLSAPNTEFKGDHSHTLKIQLRGVKKKGDPNYSRKLEAACKQRLQDNGAASELAKCKSLEGLFLEAITESLESGSGGGG